MADLRPARIGYWHRGSPTEEPRRVSDIKQRPLGRSLDERFGSDGGLVLAHSSLLARDHLPDQPDRAAEPLRVVATCPSPRPAPGPIPIGCRAGTVPGGSPHPGCGDPSRPRVPSPACALARTSLARARARITSPDRVSSASHPRSRVQAQNPGPGPAPTMPGGRSPRPGVWDPSRPRVPGSHKCRISQRLRENRAVRFPDRRLFYNGLAGRG
jgi:hypothetical protein